ncbi:MAG: class I SAM-dependent methyltransferase [Solirubrobacteraceae bacterium]
MERSAVIAGQAKPNPTAEALLGTQAAKLRCLDCAGRLKIVFVSDNPGYPNLGADGILACTSCAKRYPIIAGTPRMLGSEHHQRLRSTYPRAAEVLESEAQPAIEHNAEDAIKLLTADSFAYEWEQFGGLRDEWAKNFADYMRPHTPASLAGQAILDVGTGSGRHSFHAAQHGAHVVAVDLGASIDVARHNLPASVLTVQADAERLPFEEGAFDIVMSIGVLHHLPDPERALNSIARYARTGGHVHIYLYWVPEQRWQRIVLGLVTAARRITVRLPHKVLHGLCFPLAAGLQVAVVSPYRALRHRPRGRALAAALPLQTYADYPFSVLVNDQFDRFSAPLERRYTADEVRAALAGAALHNILVLPNHGWVADGQRT